MKKNRRTVLLVWLVLLCVLLAASLAVGGLPKGESIRETMRDAVLHEENKISLFGWLAVNPAVVSGFTVTGVLLVFALLARLFFVPRMKTVPGRFQLLLEERGRLFRRACQVQQPAPQPLSRRLCVCGGRVHFHRYAV